MPKYPKQLFTTVNFRSLTLHAMTREGICKELNEYMEDYLADYTYEKYGLDPADDRLTDEFCQSYVAFVGDLDEEMSEAHQEEAIQEMQYEALVSIGCIPQEEEEEEDCNGDAQLYLVSAGAYGLFTQEVYVVEKQDLETAKKLAASALDVDSADEVVVNPLVSPNFA